MSTLKDALFAQGDMTGAVLHVLDLTEDWPTAIEDIAHHIEYVVASSDPATRCNDTGQYWNHLSATKISYS